MGWNTGKLKSGLILLKIWYDGDSNNSGTFGHILDTYSSDFNPELSPTHKMRRNFFRAKSYRENSFKNKSLITTTSMSVKRYNTRRFTQSCNISWETPQMLSCEAPSEIGRLEIIPATAGIAAITSAVISLGKQAPILRNVAIQHNTLTQEKDKTSKKRERNTFYPNQPPVKPTPVCKIVRVTQGTYDTLFMREEIVLKPSLESPEAESKSCQADIPSHRRMTRSLGNQTSRLCQSVPKIKCHNYDPICYESENWCTATQDDGLLYCCRDCKLYTCAKKDCVIFHHKLCTCRELDPVKFPLHPLPYSH